MAILDGLLPGSFRGVPFLIKSSTVSGGRKQVVHEFPNSDKRFVEDLGLENETIDLTLTVPTRSYFTLRDSLKAAFERKGYGTLVHPLYGIRQVAVISYAVDESLDSLGSVDIKVTFKQGQELDSSGTPNVINLSLSAASLISANKAGFYSYFSVQSGYSVADKASFDASTDLATIINTAAATFTKRTEIDETKLSTYQSRISDLSVNSGTYLKELSTSSTNYYDKVKLTIVALDALAKTGEDGVRLAKILAGVSLSSPVKKATTAGQKLRVKNKNSLLSMLRVFAFAVYCRNVGFASPQTLTEVQALRDELNAQFDVLVASDTITAAVLESIKELKTKTDTVLDTQALTAPQIQEIRVYKAQLTVLEYSLYGTLEDEAITGEGLDRTTTLRLMNRIDHPDPTDISGTLKVLVLES